MDELILDVMVNFVNEISLEYCKRTDKRYVDIRNRHYIPNNGCHGQQIHFIVHYRGVIVGIISGASSVYAVESRDLFFGIPKDRKLKQKRWLPSIVNNVVFRLEYHEKNLATRVLSKWRKVCSHLWHEIYGVEVIGFETFVIETDTRKGTLYKADNWTFLGYTKGSTKRHRGLNNKHTRLKTDIKAIYAIKTGNQVCEYDYKSSWRCSTPDEKKRQKKIETLKKELLGKMF